MIIRNIQFNDDTIEVTYLENEYDFTSKTKTFCLKNENKLILDIKINDFSSFGIVFTDSGSKLKEYLNLENPTEKNLLALLPSYIRPSYLTSNKLFSYFPGITIPIFALGSQKHLEVYQNLLEKLSKKEEAMLKEAEQKKIAIAEKRKQSKIAAAKKLLQQENILPK